MYFADIVFLTCERCMLAAMEALNSSKATWWQASRHLEIPEKHNTGWQREARHNGREFLQDTNLYSRLQRSTLIFIAVFESSHCRFSTSTPRVQIVVFVAVWNLPWTSEVTRSPKDHKATKPVHLCFIPKSWSHQLAYKQFNIKEISASSQRTLSRSEWQTKVIVTMSIPSQLWQRKSDVARQLPEIGCNQDSKLSPTVREPPAGIPSVWAGILPYPYHCCRCATGL